MKIEERLKEAIERKYGNLKTFSSEIDIPYTTVRSILERGIMNAKVENVIKMAEGMGMKAEELMKIGNGKTITSIYQELNPDRQTKVYNYAEYQLDEQNASTVNDNVVSIEDYQNNVRLQSKVSAGTGILDLDPENAETITYTGKLPNYYDMAFLVSGNSMEPTFFDGDIIFVEKMSEVINGALMVVTIDDEAFIKKVYKSDRHLRLVSLNKEYKDIIADDSNDIRIVGKVVF